jgi:carbon storage regulator
MLVLSRRINEEIIIAGGIRVTVVSVKGDRVRIGVAAPPEVSVDRAEVHARRMTRAWTSGPDRTATSPSRRSPSASADGTFAEAPARVEAQR